jgi:hypothetical protein
VNTIANIEMPTQAPASNFSSATQDSDQSPVSFSDSLAAASNSSAQVSVPNEAGSKTARKQKSDTDDAKASGTASDSHAVQQQGSSQQPAQQQPDISTLQAQLTIPVAIPVQPSLDAQATSSDASTGGTGQIALNAGPRVLADAGANAGQLSSALLQGSSHLPSGWQQGVNAAVGAGSKAGNNNSGSVLSIGRDETQIPVQKASANTTATASNAAIQNADTATVANAGQAQSLPTLASAGSNAAQSQSQLPQTEAIASMSAGSNQAQPQISQADLSTIQNAASSVQVNAAPSASAVGGDASQTDSSATKIVGANAGQDAIPAALLKAVSSALQSTVPLPALHPASKPSAKGVAASTQGVASTSKATAQATTGQSAYAAGLGASSSIADQLAALTQHGSGLSAKAQSNASGVNSTSTAKASTANGSNGTGSDATGLKQHTQAASDAGSQAGSQDSSSSNDQSQSVVPAAVQSAVLPQVAPVDHSAAAVGQIQGAAIASPVQNSPALSGAAGQSVKAQDNAASVSAAVPQSAPAVNSARLIQSVGQSEMRVGMRSNEFGNISINTSSTKDLISAQISVDHGELAKTLAAHLPEVQARLGANQPMNVRIDMNGTSTGTGSGNSGSMSNGSAGQSQGGKQQAGNAASSYSGGSVAQQQVSPIMAAMATSAGRLNARLDITI